MAASGLPVPQLSPGAPATMLAQAVAYLKSLPADAALRADHFEAFAVQIETHSGGAWTAHRGAGADGSHLCLGRQAEALVIAPDGSLYRGAVTRGINVTARGLTPDYRQLKPL